MAVILRSPDTHAAAVVSLEKSIREIADIVWDAWHGALGREFAKAVRSRGDKSIGEGVDVKQIPPPVRSQLDALQRQLVGRMTDARIGSAVDRSGEDVHRSNRSSLDRQVEKAVGRRFKSKPRIGDALRSYRAEAIKRISSVRDSVIPTITKDVAHAYANGWSDERLAKHWEENGLPVEYGTVEGRARVIAATELGRLNMHVTREVHRSLGIETYRWRHSGKARYRPVHKERHGKIFGWKSAPSGGHPGNEPGCGCGADAVLDDETIEHLSEGAPDTTTIESPSTPLMSREPAMPAKPRAAEQRQRSVAQALHAESTAKRAAKAEAHGAVLAEQESAKQAEARAAALAKRKEEAEARRAAEEQARHEEAKRGQAEAARREMLETRAREKKAEALAAERQVGKASKAKRAPKVVDPDKAAKAAARIESGWNATAKHPLVQDAYVRGDLSEAVKIHGRQVIVHEYGHVVHSSLAKTPIGRALDKRYMEAFEASTREERASVSEYSLTNHREFFAESYALATAGQWDLIPERFRGVFKVITAEK